MAMENPKSHCGFDKRNSEENMKRYEKHLNTTFSCGFNGKNVFE
jgi:hypothetical protein